MSELILHPTDMSQWHALVNEAQASTRLILHENMESYLVFLLMRFSQSPELAESVLAVDFLNAMQTVGTRQVDALRAVGDKSLLLCGLFPGMAEKRHVNLSYFTDMGQAAYLTVSELQDAEAPLYQELSTQFSTLQSILNALNSLQDHLELDLGQAQPCPNFPDLPETGPQ
ncbi:MAG: hypothetical protein P1U39_08800 [Legionellaceae bacterium]|nr:hypothetical protein [Legionellaceae bacterium]